MIPVRDITTVEYVVEGDVCLLSWSGVYCHGPVPFSCLAPLRSSRLFVWRPRVCV